ncbi:hypothetical protein OPV22_009221 [Ensete ventricosum]|uniref:Very-long-chain aldehyde decarbonylase CER1-like C-terminal domain-containing protein n=1 Tax=Ensete ventricosum TaxID=4639 RepID=A0AAV8PRZ3_ENSVE|nr:hypothetical protein OPV22_009221 [Ensete ventricosum]
MPIYDYIYGTVDESSDELHERSLREKEEMVDVVHLTHLTTLQSMYHSRIGLSSLASKPYKHQWYLWIFWPFTHALVQLVWHIRTTFTVERSKLEKLRTETWMMPRYSFQGDELNGCGMLYVKRNPKLKGRIVDGTSLAVAVVLNSIPKGTQSVLLLVENVSKMALSLCLALCQIDIEVRNDFESLSFENEFVWRVAGIVHALEQWNKNECGETVSNVETTWGAALRLGFLPYDGFL